MNFSKQLSTIESEIIDSVVFIEDGTKVIREREFEGNETVKRVIIPNSVKKIEKFAF